MVMNEELTQELKNAIAAYGLLLHAAILGTELPPKFEALRTLSEDELKHKAQMLREFYDNL